MKIISGFFMAWGMFLAIPVPLKIWKEESKGVMLSLLPVIGLMVGGLWALLFFITNPLPAFLRAVMLTVFPWICTGCIHLDGYMDVCDAIFSRRDIEGRRKILKDPHSGSFAVIGIVLLALFSFAVIMDTFIYEYQVNIWGLVIIPVLSRSLASISVLNFRPMESSQYVGMGSTRKLSVFPYMLAIFIVVISTLVIKTNLALGMIFVFNICLRFANKQLGGMNGDISGFCITVSECIGVLMLFGFVLR